MATNYSTRPTVDRHDPVRRQPAARAAVSLSAIITGEVIPRLMGTGALQRIRPRRQLSVDAHMVEMFAGLALAVEGDELVAQVERLADDGVCVETLLVDLLAPTARRLGEYWVEDRCDFVDVTMGLWRLQQAVHALSGRGAPPVAPRAGIAPRALFSPMPGDQHGFGTVIVEEMFARAGWDTLRIAPENPAAINEVLAGGWFDVAGLTATCTCHIASLPSLIAGMRAASRNPSLKVMLGGHALQGDQMLAARLGADGTAGDARAAVAAADRLLAISASQVACPD
ncbi:cobalamin B12-binding domain-containing protein [Sphingomonas baiyangensis]|uniref:Cobalamin B12-binding domain-containing protein n=1 Tax=Sphingomonas baiyangensis TaxID=2572576 RepID=A0A4U1L411_9SPHN|nr:cobalamin-dependent protein [Sphingomonas baiyangensis]TKD50933.1 cobalamin B12-binding domain-containing protein [Sphingomonas baiyangensis]